MGVLDTGIHRRQGAEVLGVREELPLQQRGDPGHDLFISEIQIFFIAG